MGILLGLLAAVCWGLYDFLITHLTRRVGTYLAIAYAQTLSLVTWAGLLLLQPSTPVSDLKIWAIAVACGFCHVLGMILVYRAFEIGTLSIVSPIASGFAVVTSLLVLASGERTPAPALMGAALLILGVVLATRSHTEAEKKTLAGVPHALGCTVAFGVMYWLVEYVAPDDKLGPYWTLVVLKIMGAGSALLTIALKRSKRTAESPVTEAPVTEAVDEPILSSPRTVWMLAIGATAVDVIAWLSYIYGTRTEYTTVVIAVTSLFSVVAVLLGWAVLRERLARHQWVGVAIILAGGFLVSLKL